MGNKIICLLMLGGLFLASCTQNSGGSSSLQIVITKEKCKDILSTVPKIILRLDDIQDWGYRNPAKEIIKDTLSREHKISLAVIGGRLGKNQDVVDFLKIAVDTGKVEIAVHGNNHLGEEFKDLTYEEAYLSILNSTANVESVLDVHAVTFIPPRNVYNHNTLNALKDLDFKVISSGQNESKYEDGMLFADYTTSTSTNEENESLPILRDTRAVVQECKSALDSTRLCVVMIHPQDYVSEDKLNVDEIKYQEYEKLLTGLEGLNASFITFNDLTCSHEVLQRSRGD